MQFLKEIREHLANYETEVATEIHKFIDWLHTKYVEHGAPIVTLPGAVNAQQASTFTPATDNNSPVVAVNIPDVTASVAADAISPVVEASVEQQAEAVPADPAPAVVESANPVVEVQNGNK